MLKAKPLSSLLAQTLSRDVEYAILFTKSGSLLAQASQTNDQRQSRVIAALAANIWTSSQSPSKTTSDGEVGTETETSEDVGETHRGADYMTVALRNGKLFLQDVPVTRADLGIAEEGLLLGFQGGKDAQYGMLRLQARKVKQHLENEMSRIAG